jgi:hypothetical protein
MAAILTNYTTIRLIRIVKLALFYSLFGDADSSCFNYKFGTRITSVTCTRKV